MVQYTAYFQQTVSVKGRYTFLLVTPGYFFSICFFLVYESSSRKIENELATLALTIQHRKQWPLAGESTTVWIGPPEMP
jgi:hypothetical protein